MWGSPLCVTPNSGTSKTSLHQEGLAASCVFGASLLFSVSVVLRLALGSMLASLLVIPACCFSELLTTTDP